MQVHVRMAIQLLKLPGKAHKKSLHILGILFNEMVTMLQVLVLSLTCKFHLYILTTEIINVIFDTSVTLEC